MKRLKRMMDATGLRAMSGPVLISEAKDLTNDFYRRLKTLVFDKQPMSPMPILIALDAVRRDVVKLVDNADLPEYDREQFWLSLRALSDEALSLEKSQHTIDNTMRRELDLGAITVTTTAYKSKIPRVEDSTELVRRQVAALRQYADIWEKANETSASPTTAAPEPKK